MLIINKSRGARERASSPEGKQICLYKVSTPPRERHLFPGQKCFEGAVFSSTCTMDAFDRGEGGRMNFIAEFLLAPERRNDKKSGVNFGKISRKDLAGISPMAVHRLTIL